MGVCPENFLAIAVMTISGIASRRLVAVIAEEAGHLGPMAVSTTSLVIERRTPLRSSRQEISPSSTFLASRHG